MLSALRLSKLTVLAFSTFLLSSCINDGRGVPGKTGGTNTEATSKTDNSQSQNLPKLNYHFYLETSASTDAYLTSGITRFNTAINQLQSFLNTHPSRKSFSIHEVANVPYDVFVNATDAQVNSYFSNLSKAAIDKHAAGKASRTSSDLSNIITTVLNKTGSEDVSVLISDCVVDTKTNGNNLASQQSNLTTIVNRRLEKAPFAALILRDTTAFNGGTYYPPAGGSEKLNAHRPYFMILVGPPAAIQVLATDLSARNPFYAQSLLLGPKAAQPASTLLPPAGGLEYYKANPEDAKAQVARNTQISGPAKNFELRLRANLSPVIVSEDYKMDAANYEVQPAGYSLKVAAKKDGAYTHVFTLSNARLGPQHEVQIRMKNQLPGWVSQHSSEYTGPLKNKPSEMSKTYGLEYLVRGFAEGFNPMPYVFEMKPVQVMR